MSYLKKWRNKQLGNTNALLRQEQYCWDFMSKRPDISWTWHGLAGNFQSLCETKFKIVSDNLATGIIAINKQPFVTPKGFVDRINDVITEKTSSMYLAVNRFEFIAVNDLNIDYKDSIKDSIDQIVSHIKLPLKRVELGINDSDIDGHHFVGIHGLDVFIL